MAEIEGLEERITKECPASGNLYYKFKPAAQTSEDKADDKTAAGTGERQFSVSKRGIIETDDKSKVKIRFSDLPISRNSVTGLFKAKFVKMTEV